MSVKKKEKRNEAPTYRFITARQYFTSQEHKKKLNENMNIDDLLAKETRRLDEIDNNEELQASPVSSTFITFKIPQALLQPGGEKPTVTYLIS